MNKSEAIALANQYKNLPQFPPLVLAVPTSKNNLHTRGNRGGWHTSDYKKFRADTEKRFKLWQRQNPNFQAYRGSNLLILKLRYQLIRANHIGDRSNHAESLLDALKGLAWVDDAYIELDSVLPMTPEDLIDKENPRCIVWLNPIQICCTEMKGRRAIA